MSIIAEIHEDLERGLVRLIIEHKERLFAEAVRLCGDIHEAEDLVYRTFARAISKIDTYKGETTLYGWMRVVMTNLRSDDMRQPMQRSTLPTDPLEMEDIGGEDWRSDEELLRRSDSEALREAIGRLDPEFKKVLVMHYFGELPVKSIAAALNAPVGTILWRLSIARKILAKDLGVKLGKAKKPLAVLAAVCLAAGALFGVTKAVEWVRGVDDGESVVAAQSGAATQAFQQEERANMKAKQVVASALVAAGAVGAEMVFAEAQVAELPEDYLALEYVETTAAGRQYVDTTYAPLTPTCGFCLDAQPTAADRDERCLFGTLGPHRFISSYQARWMYGWHDGSMGSSGTLGTTDAERHLFQMNFLGSGTFDVDGDSASRAVLPTARSSASRSAFVGAYNNSGSGTYQMPMRIYRVKVSSDATTVVRDLVPALDADGVACLYDLVEGVPHYSLSASPLVAGPAKTGLVIASSSAEVGAVTPAYRSRAVPVVGKTTFAVGATTAFSDDGRTRYDFGGWELVVRAADGTETRVSGTAEEPSFEYTFAENDAAVLTWKWLPSYKVTAAECEGGTITPAEQWVAEGGSSTVHATAAADFSFVRWAGGGSGTDNPGVVDNVRSPLEVAAVFCPAYTVTTDGSDTGAGTSADPFRTVAHALAAASASARATASVVGVKVGPGTFPLDETLVVGDAIRLVGAGRGVTILDGQAKCRVLDIQHADACVSDFTIANGRVSGFVSGGGVNMGGGALCRCLVTGNATASGSGGGVYLKSPARVADCIISNNTAGAGGGVCTSGGLLENSLVCENKATTGGGIYVNRGVLIRFCTVANNAATTAGGICYDSGWGDAAHDLIVWGNSAATDPEITSAAAAQFARWTNICSSVEVGVNPRMTDPIFKNAAKHDYRLAGSSPCRDAAWGVPTSETDVLGNPRVQNGRADIGAIESDPVELSANMEIESTGHLDEATVTMRAKATNFDIEAAVCYWTFDGRPPTAADHDATGVELTHVYTNAGPCSAALAVSYDGETFVDVRENFLTVSPSRIFVDAKGAHPTYPYNTRETAANGLAEALEAAAAEGGSTVLVQPGTYVFTAQAVVQKPVRVCGEEGPDATVFDGDGKVSLLCVRAANAEVAGVTVANGAGAEAVRMEAGVLTNCVVRNNLRGGVYLKSGALVTGCVITNNAATAGGGVCTYGGTLENSLVCGNKAETGGGIHVNRGVLIRFCTVANNRATTGGGISYDSGWGDAAHDLIVWGNTASASPDIMTEGDFARWTNVCSSVAVGVRPRTGNPFFRDAARGDYRLAGSSPYRDAAWGVPTMGLDVFGNPRVRNGRADVGAIESDPDELSASIEYEASGHLDEAAVTLRAKATNFDIDEAVCYWTFDGRTPTAASHDAEGAVVTNDYGLGDCSVALAAVYDGEMFVDVKENFLTVSPSRIFVDANCARPVFPYHTRETAANGLAEALEAAAAEGGSTILVQPGTYVLAERVTVEKPVEICGEQGPSVTVFDGGGQTPLIYVKAAGASVSGVAIANGGGIGFVDPAVRIDNGVLTNCVVRNCTRGGVYARGSGLVTGCVVSNNTNTGSGGGVSMYAGTLENSLVCGNSAANGGGVGVYRGATMRFCTIVGNTATGVGGGVNCAEDNWGDMGHDNIIWGNEASASPDINTEGVAYLANWKNICSSVQVGENTSDRSLVADPLFWNAAKGNYRLRSQSPCRNAAWGSPMTAVDLDGNPRVRVRIPDIGCYECQFGAGLLLLVK